MRVEALLPDAAVATPVPPALPEAFARALDGVSDALTGANRAEDAFAAGRGSLQDAAYERARADVAISVAIAVAGRTAQVVQSLLSMQV
ncbi:MAG TPA: flagellar hook-basal body complex protein FliE [Candidatus Baltobacteraceae bacterium]